MLQSKKWEILTEVQMQDVGLNIQEFIKNLLENRGLKTVEEQNSFLHPKLEDVTVEAVGIDKRNLEKALQRIQKAIDKKEQIVIFGDYDVDGITATAILWETLYELNASVVPYIPGRIEEGYGLSIAGISNLKTQIANVSLIITVDNGIVAHEAVTFANEQGIDVIITDHHTRAEADPNALTIVHTTKLCGAGVAYLLAQEIKKGQGGNNDSNVQHLELVCLATIADLVPLTGANRTLVKFGLEVLQNTKRVGLLELFAESGIEQGTIGVYEIGHIIGPRLNAMGRMASAMDSLRLLCTKDHVRAKVLADTLSRTNKERQVLTQEMAEDALEKLKFQNVNLKNILFVSDEAYEQGVIGLVASKLVEKYYRPSIVLSIGEKITKASARSVSGFNMIEFIRKSSHLLINAGGHPMAAGFTVETEKLALLQEAMELLAQDMVTEDLLIRKIKIDCELPLSIISQKVYDAIQTLQPFGMANAEPIFVSKKVQVTNVRAIGQEGKHLKLEFKVQNSKFKGIDAIAFGFGELIHEINIGDAIDVAYVIDENTWNGNTKLQLKVKDIQLNSQIKS